MAALPAQIYRREDNTASKIGTAKIVVLAMSLVSPYPCAEDEHSKVADD